MAVNRVEVVDRNFRTFLSEWKERSAKRAPTVLLREGASLTGEAALELFESQCLSRQIDFKARDLRAKNQGFYTIGSAGHEGNAPLGRILRPTDPALLHYRSGAFMMERYRYGKDSDGVLDTLLSICAAADDPIAGGRHKVWGSRPLWVPPQTSTIASQLPKAVGMAMALGRAKRLNLGSGVPDDAIVCCSFGDASVNHSTATGAVNAAQWARHQRLPIPILFVCEDNGIGISVKTPSDWVETLFRSRPGMEYIDADGLDLVAAYEGALRAVDLCRSRRVPVFFHLRTVRLLGHAGSDMETEYHTEEEISRVEAQDPLLSSAALLLRAGVATPEELLSTYDGAKKRVEKAATVAVERPQLGDAAEIMAPLAPHHPDAVAKEAVRADYSRKETPETSAKPRHLAMLINWALADLLAKYPEMMVFGEDVAKKGGVYHVTAGLSEKFGAGRVFNTLLDEQTILGFAIGAAHLGFLPFPEIQYLAYFHNAEDQIRGEAGSLQFFSRGQFRNPLVLRVASFAYQKGFGGHFHNDNSVAVVRDIPGVVVAAPSRGDDAVGMLRTAAAAAKVDGRVVFFLEPIALYMTKDLYESDDGGWLCRYPPLSEAVPIGSGRVHGDGEDLTIVTYGNGVPMALRAARTLERKKGLRSRVLDLRWLLPLPEEDILREAGRTGHVLILDECRRSGGMAEPIAALLLERGGLLQVRSLSAMDTYIPLGPAALKVLPSEDDVVEAALDLTKKRVGSAKASK